MNRQKLSQYRDLVREVNYLKKKIESDTVKGSHDEFPFEQRKFYIHGVSSRHQRKLIKCEKLRTEIEEFIDSIEDSRTRMIFEFRYLEGMSWKDVDYFFGKYTGTYSRKIHDRFLDMGYLGY